jgi:hypothetical protein
MYQLNIERPETRILAPPFFNLMNLVRWIANVRGSQLQNSFTK